MAPQINKIPFLSCGDAIRGNDDDDDSSYHNRFPVEDPESNESHIILMSHHEK